MTKEEILKDAFSEAINVSGKHWFRDAWFILDPSPSKANILRAMGEHAKEMSIGFFKWYGVKMATFIEYITKIKPLVESHEIEEKIKEFEGKPIDELYTLYLKHLEQENKQP